MLDKLIVAEKMLPSLLHNTSTQWKSVYVDYHPPIVERLWLDIGDIRIYLHRIHSCSKEEALYHPHPWPSAIRILEGSYEMGIGYSNNDKPPVETLATMILGAGSAYSMAEPDSWHYVCPLSESSLSLMVTGKPWGRSSPKPTKVLEPLNHWQASSLLEDMRKHYPLLDLDT